MTPRTSSVRIERDQHLVALENSQSDAETHQKSFCQATWIHSQGFLNRDEHCSDADHQDHMSLAKMEARIVDPKQKKMNPNRKQVEYSLLNWASNKMKT